MAKIPDRIVRKITDALKDAGFLKPEYTEYDANGNHVATWCRDCGAKIRGWVDFENTEDGKIRQRFLALGNYTEVQFKLDDGSFMNVATCKECASDMNSPAKWAAIYAVELDAWARSLKRSNMGQEFIDLYFDKMGDKRIAQLAE